MRLKHVRIYGFKTFADRTEMNLDGGMVAIVGPNGCGKSNLVDAILWGLGEGSSRTLRAATGQDVIFNGAERRRPVGYAEVVLTFDNADGALPVDAAEVSVTRRLERGGEGKYQINRRPCRLRDVHDLLSDSGLGRSGYAIVGQKEIDAALSASAEERRAWIDEAAGVQRYRSRKGEATRRLTSARDHLMVVGHTVREIENQLTPLRAEAEAARIYRSLRERFLVLERRVLEWELRQASLERRAASEALPLAARAVVEASEAAEAGRVAAEAAALRADERERIHEMARVRENEAIAARARADGGLALAEQVLTTTRERILMLTREAGGGRERRDEAEGELLAAREAAKVAARAAYAAREEAAVAERDETLARRAGKAHEDEIVRERRRVTEAARAEARRATLGERAARSRAALADLDRAIPDLDAALIEHAPIRDAAQARIGAASAALAAARQALQERRAAIREEEASLRAGDDNRARLQARLDALESLAAGHEGLAQGPRAVVEASERGVLSGCYVPVGETIRSDPAHAAALETALGAAANDLVVDDERDAKAAIEWLKRTRSGRATFQPIPLMRPPAISAELRRLLGTVGVVGRAAELARSEPRYRPVIESLLGRVVVTAALDDALALARTSGWSRMVTLEGETVHASGAVSGGVLARQGAGVVARGAEIERIQSELKTLPALRAARGTEREETAVAAAEAAASLARSEAEETEIYARALEGERRAFLKERERLVKDLDEERGSGPQIELGRLERLESDAPALAAATEAAVRRLVDARARAESEGRRAREAESASAGAARRRDAAGLDAAGRAAEAERLAGVERGQVLELSRAEMAADMAVRAEAAAEAAVRVAGDARRAASEEAGAATAAALLAREASSKARVAEERAARRVEESERKESEARAKLIEEFGISEAVAAPPPTDDERAEAASLRRKLRAMGDVNVGSIEAFERLEARHAEIVRQRDDVLGGIAELEGSICELDGLVRGRFVAAFERVGIEFTSAFARLFEGGRGELLLTDPEDVETGIEVAIQLPGKRRQPLAALSGGERALTTVALLYALLKVRPSPLVVLDEVDAPLDASNVERLSDLLQELTDTVQFLVITHNPTTIERAPLWLGVSMQEPGVSTLVPARIPGSLNAP